MLGHTNSACSQRGSSQSASGSLVCSSRADVLTSSRRAGHAGPKQTSIACSSVSQQACACWLPFDQHWIAGRSHRPCVLACSTRKSISPATSVLTLAPSGVIEDKELHEEAAQSYLSYAMSVIVGRALPDVRDGLKPVHRRILFAMHDLGLAHTKPYKKCARVVGEVLGKYHPHGDTAVYDTLVRMAQDFSMRHQLVAGHGNFGSLDNDPAAAMRYTECRLQGLSADMLLADLDQDVVDFSPNFDSSQEEPTVLPAKVPLLLINGSQGIAVGIATKIPPHNMHEIVAGLSALIHNPDITPAELHKHIPAPDFPTGGVVSVGTSLLEAYTTGSGSMLLRAKVDVEEEGVDVKGSKKTAGGATATRRSGSGVTRLVITEVPYQVNKAQVVTHIAELVESKTLEGIADVRDESDRTGTRMVVEVKPGVAAEGVLQELYKHTRLQISFSCNMVALVDGTPKLLGLKDFLVHFLEFRCQVVRRRAQYQLHHSQRRLHLVEGYLIALATMDDVVRLIRAAVDTEAARVALIGHSKFSKEQAEAVLALPLRRLTSMERQALEEEQATLSKRMSELQRLLGSEAEVLKMVEVEAQAVAAKHGNPRRTRIVSEQDLKAVSEELVALAARRSARAVLIMSSAKGFMSRVPADSFTMQHKGGKGKGSTGLREGDCLDQVVRARETDQLLVITAEGRAHSIKVAAVPEPTRSGFGSAVAQVVGTNSSLRVVALMPLPVLPSPQPVSAEAESTGAQEASPSQESLFLVLATQQGGIKKIPLVPYLYRIAKAGSPLLTVDRGDALGWATAGKDTDGAVLASSNGRVLVFGLTKMRAAGNSAGTVKGMRLAEGNSLVSMALVPHTDMEHMRQEEAAGLAPEAAQEAGDEVAPSTSAAGATSAAQQAGPWLLFVTAMGKGKRVPLAAFKCAGRGQMGTLGIKIVADTDDSLMAVRLVRKGDEVVLGSIEGKVSRVSVDEIQVSSRHSMGSKLMDLSSDCVQTVTILSLASLVEQQKQDELWQARMEALAV